MYHIDLRAPKGILFISNTQNGLGLYYKSFYNNCTRDVTSSIHGIIT